MSGLPLYKEVSKCQNPLLAATLQYAREGGPVVPLHTPTDDPDKPCSCRRFNCPDLGAHPCHKNTCKEIGKHPCHQTVCTSVGKHPRTINGVYDATTDEATIRRWWEQWPNANVGGAMGKKAKRFTLDKDPRNGGGDTLAGLVAEHGELPTTRTAHTGGDGNHYIFKWPEGFEGKFKDGLGPGLDIKADGGLIVLAPSLHASGNLYRWLNDAPVVGAPQWMLDMVMGPKTATGTSSEVGETIPDGSRNKTLASLAGTMRRRGMDAAEIEAALLVTNERRCKPPLDSDEVRKIAESVSKYAAADSQSYYATSLPPEEPPDWVGWPPDVEPSLSQPHSAKKDESKNQAPLAVSWADFDAEQFVQGERVAFAVERGELALLNALPNAGKTTLALIIALCLSIGRRFLPVVTEGKARRVLYIDGETRRARLQRDIRTMTKDFSREEAIAVGQNLHVICEAEIKGESLALTRTDHLLAVSVESLRVKPDFIVIDTLSSLCPVFNENDNAEQTRKVWRPLQKIARDCDAAILVLLNPETRWLSVQTFEPQKVVTALERVLEVITVEMTTAEIKARLKPTYQESAVKKALAEALQENKLKYVKRGVYGPVEKTVQTVQTAKEAVTDDVDGTEEGDFDEPYYPYAPIVSTDSMKTITTNEDNDLDQKQQKAKKPRVRKPPATKNEGEKPYVASPPMTSTDSKVESLAARRRLRI